MAGFHKDKETGKWYCDDCGEEVPLKQILKPYDYFKPSSLAEHECSKS